jgi:hypothetical protein
LRKVLILGKTIRGMKLAQEIQEMGFILGSSSGFGAATAIELSKMLQYLWRSP